MKTASLYPLRPELTTLPDRMRYLPVDKRGYPVPWFVSMVNGEPEFRAADGEKWIRAVREKRCWVCGAKLGVHQVFVLGPMCGITRTTSEPPAHLDCAIWSVRNCPFLTKPHMTRRENDLPAEIQDAAGMPIHRNPGVTLVWVAREFSIFDADNGMLIRVGPPESVDFFAEGRPAAPEEIAESIRTGLPILQKVAADQSPEAEQELAAQVKRFYQWIPKRAEVLLQGG